MTDQPDKPERLDSSELKRRLERIMNDGEAVIEAARSDLLASRPRGQRKGKNLVYVIFNDFDIRKCMFVGYSHDKRCRLSFRIGPDDDCDGYGGALDTEGTTHYLSNELDVWDREIDAVNELIYRMNKRLADLMRKRMELV